MARKREENETRKDKKKDQTIGSSELDKPEDFTTLNAKKFINQLLTAANSPNDRIFVVICTRPEMLAEAGHFPGLAEAINQDQILISPLQPKEVKSMIAGPIERISQNWTDFKNYRFNYAIRTPSQQKNSARVLADTIWETYLQTSSGERIPLPLIQQALKNAWEQAKDRYLSIKSRMQILRKPLTLWMSSLILMT